MIEVFVHIQRLEDLTKGKPTNVKVNYADQYDIKVILNPKKYVITKSREATNVLTIRKKTLFDYLGFKKKSR